MIFFQVLKKHFLKNWSVLFLRVSFDFCNPDSPVGKCQSFSPRQPYAFNTQLDTAGLTQILKTTQVGTNVYYFLVLDKRLSRRRMSHPVSHQASCEIIRISSNHPLGIWGEGQFFFVRGRKKQRAGERKHQTVCCLSVFISATKPFCQAAADAATSRMKQARPSNVFSHCICLKPLHYEQHCYLDVS